jgi:hypothetical protein
MALQLSGRQLCLLATPLQAFDHVNRRAKKALTQFWCSSNGAIWTKAISSLFVRR